MESSIVKLIDPLAALAEDRAKAGLPSSSDILGNPPKAKPVGLKARTALGRTGDPIKDDFRVFLTLIWRHCLGVDPSPLVLNMGEFLQYGPDRSIIMALRGAAKSWTTGAYALWRLYRDPREMIAVVSGNLKRAQATTSWCLQVIMTMPLLAHMIPKPNYRQSAQMFDVGSCDTPQQSANMAAFGILGQMAGFRATLIIPDDCETQSNSITVGNREKVRDAVKEFESILTPGGQIKYLGTPHESDSLYLYLLSLKNKDDSSVYACRIWPARYPTEEQRKAYGPWLAPWVSKHIQKHGPSVIGRSTMPTRFSDEDLAKREAAIGKSEFALQFLLDLTGELKDRYPLKLSDLTVMPLDDHRGPAHVAWGNDVLCRELPVIGLSGDHYYQPSEVSPERFKYQRVVGFIDPSGRGKDETALSIVAELFGKCYWLHLGAWKEGFEEATLRSIARATVRFGVHDLFCEDEFGGGMFMQLLAPILQEEWTKHIAARKAAGDKEFHGGTKLEPYKTPRASKEKRILGILEPVTQQHRLVVNEAVIQWDYKSVMAMEGEDGKRNYAFAHQFTHLTAEKDCLRHDDRLDSLAGALSAFADVLGVMPAGSAERALAEQYDEELARLLGLDEEQLGWSQGAPQGRGYGKVFAALPTKRN